MIVYGTLGRAVFAFVVLVAIAVPEAWMASRVLAGRALVWDALGFSETPCVHVTTDTTTGPGDDDDETLYFPVLVCAYEVAGISYTVDNSKSNLPVLAWAKTDTDARVIADQYLAVHTPHAFYDAHDPSRALIAFVRAYRAQRANNADFASARVVHDHTGDSS